MIKLIEIETELRAWPRDTVIADEVKQIKIDAQSKI